MEHSLDHVVIYTDGACKGNPGPGGWGAILRSGAHEIEISGGGKATTNNRMELMAVIEGLRKLKRGVAVAIYTDSRYVMDGAAKWLPAWKKRGWRTADNKPVKNDDLWRRLDELATRHEIQWVWVRGHAGNDGNEHADALANRGVAELLAAMGKERI